MVVFDTSNIDAIDKMIALISIPIDVELDINTPKEIEALERLRRIEFLSMIDSPVIVNFRSG